jgi:hypothetical protein
LLKNAAAGIFWTVGYWKMLFSDLGLSRRLERAEGFACVQFAEARRRLFPDSGAEWIECGGAYAVFDGAGSPVTQTFGLGLWEALSPASLDEIERFFGDRGAPVLHEISPLGLNGSRGGQRFSAQCRAKGISYRVYAHEMAFDLVGSNRRIRGNSPKA